MFLIAGNSHTLHCLCVKFANMCELYIVVWKKKELRERRDVDTESVLNAKMHLAGKLSNAKSRDYATEGILEFHDMFTKILEIS